MSATIFEKPVAVCSLEKKKTEKYSPFFDKESGQVYAYGLIVPIIVGTIVGTVVGQIVVTAWPY